VLVSATGFSTHYNIVILNHLLILIVNLQSCTHSLWEVYIIRITFLCIGEQVVTVRFDYNQAQLTTHTAMLLLLLLLPTTSQAVNLRTD